MFVFASPVTATSPIAPVARSARRRRAHRSTRPHRRFRPALASWYGGGGSLACGGYLTSSTMGVANKTLPCGTVVTIRYGGRSVRVRVIDRGPYVEGREFDLTEATKTALGFEGVGEIWVREGGASAARRGHR
jgi:rare lipoprotein A